MELCQRGTERKPPIYTVSLFGSTPVWVILKGNRKATTYLGKGGQIPILAHTHTQRGYPKPLVSGFLQRMCCPNLHLLHAHRQACKQRGSGLEHTRWLRLPYFRSILTYPDTSNNTCPARSKTAFVNPLQQAALLTSNK